MRSIDAKKKRMVETWEQVSGVVRAADEARDEASVALESGVVCVARRAASCLLAPEMGDRVLVARASPGGEAYLLAVLERAARVPSRLALRGDTEVVVEGRLSFAATHGLAVATPGDVSVMAAQGRLCATGPLEACAQSLLVRADNACRMVEGVEQVRAGAIDYAAKSTLRAHAGSAVLTADALVKIDAEQVQLG